MIHDSESQRGKIVTRGKELSPGALWTLKWKKEVVGSYNGVGWVDKVGMAFDSQPQASIKEIDPLPPWAIWTSWEKVKLICLSRKE